MHSEIKEPISAENKRWCSDNIPNVFLTERLSKSGWAHGPGIWEVRSWRWEAAERGVFKNAHESYAFNMKATVEDEKLQGKINDEDKQDSWQVQ